MHLYLVVYSGGKKKFNTLDTGGLETPSWGGRQDVVHNLWIWILKTGSVEYFYSIKYLNV